MLFLRSLVFQIVYYANLFFWMVLWLPALPLHRRVTLELGRQWGRTSLWWLEKICGVKHEFRGLENIRSGAVIVACKHQSVWDTFVLPLLFPDFSYILKRELVFIPFFGWYLLSAEQIAIDRSKGGKLLPQLVRKTKEIFAQGRQLFIFPEGTRRPAGAPAAYKFGVAQIYKDTGAPVIPAALNSGLFWARRAFIIRPGTVVLEFLPAIEPGMSQREFFTELQNRMETASDALIAEAVAKDPSLAPIVEANRKLPAKAQPSKG
ncbi:lysophospholipid acyltransferase family protein [Methylocystis heyeri]|uniref:1-acyl-sn-glycerol-3-phosphate acyltransferase n=1 Tax=Methylocystis heyeri TaxID=391905 RepID=A0A6B8KCI3_9HYPH|nr:lysophospholipid acyltransferase family protein [Methylocystis heyeri]QGM45387.1 1-acyl-sn-glycerol-3-phosphate acyltransferase [Methylocystis heyeri]